MGRSGLPTSSWGETAVDDAYAQENFERFLFDLGINAIDVLILSTVHDANDAYDAARRGETATAILYVGFTICDVAKPCQSILAPTKGLRRAAKAGRKADLPSSGGVTRRFEQPEDKLYYRVYSGNATIGGWVTALPPKSSAWAKEALALPPGNKATMVQKVLIPKGTAIERSRATPMPEWGRTRGGAEQFKLLDEIPRANFGEGMPLP
jgi:hypothetical protein